MTTLIACKPRSPEALLEVVGMVDPEHNPELQRRDITGDGHPETFCNWAVHQMTALLGCAIPKVLAHDQIDWLDGVGADLGWREVGVETARERAALGEVVVATWANVRLDKDPQSGLVKKDDTGRLVWKSAGPSHVALVIPTPASGTGVYIAQAGAKNFNSGPARDGFGNLPIRFFHHA